MAVTSTATGFTLYFVSLVYFTYLTYFPSSTLTFVLVTLVSVKSFDGVFVLSTVTVAEALFGFVDGEVSFLIVVVVSVTTAGFTSTFESVIGMGCEVLMCGSTF